MSKQELKTVTSEVMEAAYKASFQEQISVAKQYPRNETNAIAKMKRMATLSKETAEEMFYAIPRTTKDKQTNKLVTKFIEGESVRFAEIAAQCWGNLRISTHIVKNDGNTVTAVCVVWDLESNMAVSSEVVRNIVDSEGRTYNQDMQIVTMMAAQSIAFRNGVFKVVPKAILESIIKDIKEVALGNSASLEQIKDALMRELELLGVKRSALLEGLGVLGSAELSREHCLTMRGLLTGIKEGTVNAKDVFKIKESKSKQLSSPDEE